jgi:formate dehydrogenase subunit delta
MSGIDRLVYMANQIARNVVVGGGERAIAATADHIAAFWDPRMRRGIAEHVAAGGVGLDPVALAALRQLVESGPPPSQTPATHFAAVDEAGGSDAG